MNHRISAGALIVHDDRILLVRHHRPGAYDFWVAPGGGGAAWHTEAALTDLQLFPEVLRERFWRDREQGFGGLRHLGQRAMAFW